MAGRTLTELTEDLASVRLAIRAAEKSQSYRSSLGQQKDMALLTTLYQRETDLLAERSALLSGGSVAGPVWNRGVINRG